MKFLPARVRAAKRSALLLAATLLLAPSARSTWSIIAVDTRTGEVCIAAATCLRLDLELYLPVVRVGVGGACAQSNVDSNGVNRLAIWNAMIEGRTPEEILAGLLANPGQNHRQYGIVTALGDPVSHTGPTVNQAYYSIARTIEGISYAIQGNVLTGKGVITNAENAFLTAQGDLSQRVMAAMEGARALGGDGRCSCDMIQPTSCGCPPSAWAVADLTAFLIVARNGDTDGVCNAAVGCATGSYFCNLNVIGIPTLEDPVTVLLAEYATWRSGLQGRADQIRSLVSPSSTHLPADGSSELTVEVELRDIEDDPVVDAAATISIARAYEGPPVAKIGTVERVAPGRFRFTVRARNHAGEGRWRITARQNGSDVLLWPELVIQVGPP